MGAMTRKKSALTRKKSSDTARRLASAASESRLQPLAPRVDTPMQSKSEFVQKVIAPGTRWKAKSVSGLVGEPSKESRERAERSSKALKESEEDARRQSSTLGRF